MSKERGDGELLLRDRDLVMRVSRRGGALMSARYRGSSFMVGAGGPGGDMASFPLVPFGNRVEGNVFHFDGRDYRFQPNSADPLYLHGDGWLERWNVDDADRRRVRLSLSHHPDAVSPYRYQAEQDIRIEDDAVALDLSVRNDGDRPLPFGLGQHPFFLRTPATRLTIRCERFWGERGGHLPGPASPLPVDLDFSNGALLPGRWVNNAFGGWDGHATIVWPELGLRAEIEADRIYGRYMLYMPVERADFFCLEPMSHLPNGHHMAGRGGLAILAPGESLSGGVRIGLATLPEKFREIRE
ncbi:MULTISPECIES: aldose 1-epimerase [unclassified Sinorhizobium]|uniref:aldose 1-epimerase n=1 Tax=unclassified Sinorhizobium TaxID=2613772 RepID=UPI003525D287